MNRTNRRTLVVLAGLLAGSLAMEGALARGGMGHGGPGGFGGPDGRPPGSGAAVQMDTDEDGLISQMEFLAAATSRAEDHFSHMDRDGDGLIASDELPPARGHHAALSEEDQATLDTCLADALGTDAVESMPTPEERFAASDTNGDGHVDEDEMVAEETARATERFTLLDSDADGYLSDEERSAGRSAAFEVRQARMACMMELRGGDGLLLRY